MTTLETRPSAPLLSPFCGRLTCWLYDDRSHFAPPCDVRPRHRAMQVSGTHLAAQISIPDTLASPSPVAARRNGHAGKSTSPA